MEKRKGNASYAVLFAGVFALSSSAVFVKLADAPSAVTAFYRLFLTALVLTPFLVFSRKNRKELLSLRPGQIAHLVLAGVLLSVHYIMWFESLNYTSVSSSAVLVALQPLYSILFGLVFLKESVSKSGIIGCLIAIIGSAVIGFGDFQINSTALWGDLLAFAAAGVIAAYFLIGQVVRKNISAVTYSVPSYFSSVLFLLIYILIRGESLTGYSGQTWGAFLGISLIATIGGQFIFNLLLKNMSATAVTMGILGEPAGTCILAYLILGERIAPRQFAGMLIILAGLGIYFFYPKKQMSE